MNFLLFLPMALSNGLTTHCWISTQAVSNLPPGELHDFMSDSDLERFWRNGTMFPDGGYPQGDGYSEIAHWEPFQISYLNWIKENYQYPWPDEASQHIAFLMGMTSHGMADQSFDAMYMSRAWVYDADSDWGQSMDTANDVVFSSLTGPQPVPEAWVPTDVFIPLFDLQGHTVDSESLYNGQSLVQTAVTWVGSAGQVDELADGYYEQFPWANENLLSETISGAPPIEAELIAEYWQVIWDRLHEGTVTSKVIRTFPAASDFDHEIDSEDIESRISIVFSKGLLSTDVSEDYFNIQDSSGGFHPVAIDVFYGLNSHIVHLLPLQDFLENTDYTIQVSSDVPFIDGSTLENDEIFVFTTRSPPNEPEAEEPYVKRGCSSHSSQPRVALLCLGIGLLFGFKTRRVLGSEERK